MLNILKQTQNIYKKLVTSYFHLPENYNKSIDIQNDINTNDKKSITDINNNPDLNRKLGNKIKSEYNKFFPNGYDPDGDIDGDGKINRFDSDMDGDNILNHFDKDPTNPNIGAKYGKSKINNNFINKTSINHSSIRGNKDIYIGK